MFFSDVFKNVSVNKICLFLISFYYSTSHKMGEAEYLGEVLLNFFWAKKENWLTLRKKPLEALFLGGTYAQFFKYF